MAQKQKKVKYILDHIGYSRTEMDDMSVLGSDDAIYVEFKDGNDVDFMASSTSDYPVPIEQLTDVDSGFTYDASTSLTAVTIASGTTQTVTLETFAIDSNARSYYVTPQTDYIAATGGTGGVSAWTGVTGLTYDETTGILSIDGTLDAGTYEELVTYMPTSLTGITSSFAVYITT